MATQQKARERCGGGSADEGESDAQMTDKNDPGGALLDGGARPRAPHVASSTKRHGIVAEGRRKIKIEPRGVGGNFFTVSY